MLAILTREARKTDIEIFRRKKLDSDIEVEGLSFCSTESIEEKNFYLRALCRR